jgi:hypothetical protein
VRGETWSTVALSGRPPAAGSAGELARLGRLDEGRWPLAVFLGPAVVADPWRAGDESALISETLISQARGARVASVSSLALAHANIKTCPMSELQSTFAAMLIRAHKERESATSVSSALGCSREVAVASFSRFPQSSRRLPPRVLGLCSRLRDSGHLPCSGPLAAHGWQLQALPPFALDPMLTERSELQSK